MSGRLAVWLVAGSLLSLAATVSAAHRPEGEAGAAPEFASIALAEGDHFEPGLFEAALTRLDERLARYPQDLEASLLKGLVLFKAGHRPEALAELGSLTRRAPRFHLAHLIQGDMLLAQAQPVQDIGTTPLIARLPIKGEGLDSLRDEAEARLKAYLDTLPRNRLPHALLALGDSVRHAFVVDKESHRLYVYERTESDAAPRLVRDFYVSTGKLAGNKSLRGDLRTPEGVYFVTGYIPRSRLPDKYGVGAFPVSYPNEYDARQGKTGDGIWLHGTEQAYYSRPPLDSEGCVVLPNEDLQALAEYIRPGMTPVVIEERVRWLDREEWLAARGEILSMLEAWRSDWESSDVERYLGHYAGEFWSEGHDAKSWAARKRAVALGKSYQQIRFSDVSAFAYPRSATNGAELVVVNLRQEYRSNNFNSEMQKRLYFRKENGEWRVLYEGTP